MLTRTIALIATSALAVKLVQHLRRRQELPRLRDDRQLHHQEVNRWEAEGGNLPPAPQR